MKTHIFALTCLLTASSLYAQDVKTSTFDMKPYAVLLAGSAADLASTIYAIESTPGAHEANPLLSHGGTPGLIASKLALTAGLTLMVRTMETHGHPKFARSLAYVEGFALGGIAVHNARVGK